MMRLLSFSLLLAIIHTRCSAEVERVFVLEGNELTLSCHMTGLQSSDTVEWRTKSNRNNLSDSNDPRIRIGYYNVLEGTSTLTIDFVSHEDSDDYYCIEPQQNITSPIINVIVPYSPLIQAQELPPNRTFYNAFEGEDMVLFCTASGKSIQIRWLDDNGTDYKNHNDNIFNPLFSESTENRMIHDEELNMETEVTVSTLIFPARSYLDGSNFTCRVWYYDDFEDSSSIQLFVYETGLLSWTTIGMISGGAVILLLVSMCARSIFSEKTPAYGMDIQVTTVPVGPVGPLGLSRVHPLSPKPTESYQIPNYVTNPNFTQTYPSSQGPSHVIALGQGPV